MSRKPRAGPEQQGDRFGVALLAGAVCGGLWVLLVGEPRADGLAESLIQDRLSPREQQVVQLIVRGFSNLEIASRLGITEATVKAHLTHIFQKLALRGRGQLVARYHQSLSPAVREAGAASG